ncbi:glycerate kinase type-2 family protein [Pseudoponticoccus marisrubri]|uniref:Hydroxypyruvate reductase n=1 Tax=Pseudoponticoccus marisrubri TaxID=1685382 RepID=A0A0W7WLX9_9RHOB|nr:glycerate kinase [Pseudoponticoccus marisrubri]KUF11596.1 hydroxypyruvate reductase [Pseudoponticoccus marisrubri]
MDDRAFLTELFDAAVAAADPMRALAGALPEKPAGRTVVVALGKGAAQMAAAFETLWDAPVEGVVVTRYGYATDCRHLPVLEASHPVPDAAGEKAAAAVMQAVSGLGPDDLVVALVCGGGSALLPAPPEGMTLKDEQALNRALLASGAPIGVMNAIRKHVSRIKGGRLAAAAHPARVVSLVVSDVPGDDPAQVASGPTVPDSVGRDQVLAMIRNRNIKLPENIMAHISSDASTAPDPRDEVYVRNEVRVVASARLSLEAAAKVAEAHGIAAPILSDAIEGEAHVVGQVHGAIAREIARHDRPFARPVVVLSGGETSVTLTDTPGRGGRNTAFLMGLAGEIEGLSGVTVLAADTDGIDGTEPNAGAFVDGGSFARMREAGLDPADVIQRQDPWGAFDAVGDIFAPGPTGTNVNDFRAMLIKAQS